MVKFTKTTVTIDFPIKEGGSYHLDLELYEAINTAKSKKVHRLDSQASTREALGIIWAVSRR